MANFQLNLSKKIYQVHIYAHLLYLQFAFLEIAITFNRICLKNNHQEIYREFSFIKHYYLFVCLESLISLYCCF